jgi:hypothetical protein
MSIQGLFIGVAMLAGCDDAEPVPGIQAENEAALAQTPQVCPYRICAL